MLLLVVVLNWQDEQLLPRARLILCCLLHFSVVFFGFYPLGVSLVSKVQVYMESSRAKLMKFIETAFGHRVLVEISAFSCIPSFADQGSIWRIRSLFTEKKIIVLEGLNHGFLFTIINVVM